MAGLQSTFGGDLPLSSFAALFIGAIGTSSVVSRVVVSAKTRIGIVLRLVVSVRIRIRRLNIHRLIIVLSATPYVGLDRIAGVWIARIDALIEPSRVLIPGIHYAWIDAPPLIQRRNCRSARCLIPVRKGSRKWRSSSSLIVWVDCVRIDGIWIEVVWDCDSRIAVARVAIARVHGSLVDDARINCPRVNYSWINNPWIRGIHDRGVPIVGPTGIRSSIVASSIVIGLRWIVWNNASQVPSVLEWIVRNVDIGIRSVTTSNNAPNGIAG